MLFNLIRLSTVSPGGARHFSSTRFVSNSRSSYVPMHRSFPATLYRFQVCRESRLFDRAIEHDHWEGSDGVELSRDGLVHPHVAKGNPWKSNGALFMPNTHFMQEITRMSYDNYMEGLDNGQPPSEPHYLCIPKGTTLPPSLTLYREYASRFTLQPSLPMSLDALNQTLTQFYRESGCVISAPDWLDKNPYSEAGFDDEEGWMEK
ncbi:uncharacterized protein N7459_006236 [Penicillium hispanicum]|uniref:uncharacterized protein n=1 Tax=Penicillium hispanicum TaxID=1080232 RepID=UPI0025417E2B|nr:uncharacterized protein N7459_006236 [Penicillium hispanicum]KAJ5580251.1 hypothetical protein N7459_006236 [Penicillium hispanicum]